MKNSNHTYVICAYKESAFLEECILSVINQTVPSVVKMATSTPNDHIRSLAEKYGLELLVNEGEKGIAGDWNFAYSCADTKYITIAHQDDVYKKTYTEEILVAMRSAAHPLIAFSDYSELRNGEEDRSGKNLKIKRILLTPLKIKGLQGTGFAKRFALRFGNAICCPAVTYAAYNLPKQPFKAHFRSNIDWQTWERFSRKKGEFVFVNKSLMCHRIHEDSETSAVIGDNMRGAEDYEMFCKFWPKWIAKRLTGAYAASEESNEVK